MTMPQLFDYWAEEGERRAALQHRQILELTGQLHICNGTEEPKRFGESEGRSHR
jgi:hypothetical protein